MGTRRRRIAKSGMWTATVVATDTGQKNSGCKNKEISKTFIEGAVFERLTEYVFNNEYLDFVTAEYNSYLQQKTDDSGKRKVAERRLKAVQKNIDSLVELVIKSKSPTLLERLDILEADKVRLEQEVRELEY